MLLNAKLPKSFWGEAVSTAAYLINRSPSSAVNFKTPMKMWNGVASDYSNLRIFGYKAYAHIKQDKLEPRALRCVFIGYHVGVQVYNMWCLEAGKTKCIISRDVVFDDTQMADLHTYKLSSTSNSESTQFEVEHDHQSNKPHEIRPVKKLIGMVKN